ncbi:MAG: type II toxin-antitoxin system HigB family toxin [Bacteroidetes bacterium]|nr:type II toxin-antitoxin system HigB family toxin [Bacteroidota bacterium]
MRVFVRKTLVEFWLKHPDAEQSLKAWYAEVSKNKWETSNYIKKRYPTVSVVKNNVIIFRIKGNSYRLIVKINFLRGWVFIRFIGTHAEYDKLDANNF